MGILIEKFHFIWQDKMGKDHLQSWTLIKAEFIGKKSIYTWELGGKILLFLFWFKIRLMGFYLNV